MTSVSVAPTRADPWAELRSLPAVRRGVGGALGLYAALVGVWVCCVPLFGPADERAHVDYAWQVAHGHLPVAGTPFTAEFPQLGQVSYVQHVANHPPLYYAVVGPLLRLADALGHPALGLYAARLLGAGTTLVALLVIARIAAEVTARAAYRWRVGAVVGATLLAAVDPALVAASGAVQNDAPSVLLAALVVLVLARAARTGVSSRLVAQLAVLCTLGMLTRVTFLTVAVLAVLALVGLSLLRDRSAVRLALLRGLAVVAAVVAGSGWFLLLNQHRYGDLTGGSAVYHLESVEERTLAPGAAGGPVSYLLHPQTWWTQLQQLVAPVPSIADGRVLWTLATVVALLVLAGSAVALLRAPRPRVLDRAGVLTLAFLALLFAASMAKLAVHVSHRGGANQRYLLDALGFWTVGGALLLLALGRLAPYAVGLLGALGAAGTVGYAAGIVQRTGRSVALGVPLGAVLVLLAAAALVVAVRALTTREVAP